MNPNQTIAAHDQFDGQKLAAKSDTVHFRLPNADQFSNVTSDNNSLAASPKLLLSDSLPGGNRGDDDTFERSAHHAMGASEVQNSKDNVIVNFNQDESKSNGDADSNEKEQINIESEWAAPERHPNEFNMGSQRLVERSKSGQNIMGTSGMGATTPSNVHSNNNVAQPNVSQSRQNVGQQGSFTFPTSGPTHSKGTMDTDESGNSHRTSSLPTVFKYQVEKTWIGAAISVPIFLTIYCLSQLPFEFKSVENKSNPDFLLDSNRWSFFGLCVLNFVFSLVGYSIVQFWAVNGTAKLMKHLYACSVAAILSVVLMLALTYGNFPYWFYYLDVFVLVVVYVICCLSYGWHSTHADVAGSMKAALQFTVCEVIVAAVSLIYGMWLMPAVSLMPLWAMVLWRTVAHPLYFEFLVLFPVRTLLELWSTQGNFRILDSLVLGHAQVHIITMGALMVCRHSDVQLAVVSMICLTWFQFYWRSTGLMRIHNTKVLLHKLNILGKQSHLINTRGRDKHLAKERNPTKVVAVTVSTQYAAEAYTVELLTESILETAATFFSAFTVYMLEARGQSNYYQIHSNDSGTGQVSAGTTFAIIMVQLVATFFSDILFFWFNFSSLQMLPIGSILRKMRKHQVKLFVFLCYGMLTMGLVCNLYFIASAPRSILCTSPDSSTCFYNK